MLEVSDVVRVGECSRPSGFLIQARRRMKWMQGEFNVMEIKLKQFLPLQLKSSTFSLTTLNYAAIVETPTLLLSGFFVFLYFSCLVGEAEFIRSN